MKKSSSLVKPKKKLGQHFLKSSDVAKKIVDCLNTNNICSVLEVGPGMGILTEHLIDLNKESFFVEIDKESVIYLKQKYNGIDKNIIEEDFLLLKVEEKNTEFLLKNFDVQLFEVDYTYKSHPQLGTPLRDKEILIPLAFDGTLESGPYVEDFFDVSFDESIPNTIIFTINQHIRKHAL